MRCFILLFLLTTSCASQPDLYTFRTNPRLEWFTRTLNPKYASYDPCFSCGEDWSPQIPNKRFEDQERINGKPNNPSNMGWD